MSKRDPRIDTYIQNAAGFAQPVLRHLRELVHAACPEVEETMKWSIPYFMHEGMLCNMAAFKGHCTFGFWKGRLIFGKGGSPAKAEQGGMGQFGRITSLTDLPKDRELTAYIKKAVQLNEEGVQPPARPKSKEKKELVVPQDLAAALNENKKALTAFEKFSYSHKKEYVEWITEAKREETRKSRLATAIEWMAEGKARNWKYANC